MAKSFTGVVVSNKTDKTIVILVSTRKTHPIYKKQYTRGRKFMAHDEKNEAQMGDRVTITETRPISARKRFALTSIVTKAVVSHKEDAPTVAETKKKSVADKPASKAQEEAK
ncbi:30S ribosomal protein S17 [Candidatus Saccharibacteria bacterium]|jgi:small subunit ribosomal protein S17|nr:30S ribosomal protein S17 [Candidatus Saccharibacteria bacterium]